MEKEQALISIIVPVYNVENYLERCMQSIWKQTYTNLEIILVDDGSTDASGSMCDEYAKKDIRIKVIHKENGGLSDARNAGLAIATGDYIGYVDSDDWIEPDMYATMYQACEENCAELAVCRYQCSYDGSKPETGSGKKTVFDREALLDVYIRDDEEYIIYNSVWSKLFRADLVRDMIFPKGRNSEDIMYTTRAFCRTHKAVYIDSFFYHYVVDRVGSIMNEKQIERMFRDELPFWREHIALIQTDVSEYFGKKAAYFYYRRLLFYYINYRQNQKKVSDRTQKKENRQAAEKIALEWKLHRKEILQLFSYDFAKKGDIVRMRCMLFSPSLYYVVDSLYQNLIIPLRKS